MSYTIERLREAVNSLSRRRVKTRDMGHCDGCDAVTTSGMNKLCDECAEAAIETAARELEELEALTDEERKVLVAMRDFTPARVEMFNAIDVKVWHRKIVR